MVAKNQSITLLWILRILVILKADRSFVTRFGFEDSQLAAWLGLTDLTEDGDLLESTKEADPVKIRSALAKAHAKIERQANQLIVPPTLAGNVSRISALVGLSDAECRILEFALLIQSTSVLRQACEYVKRLENQRLFEVLATILGLAENDVRMALRSDGVLSKTGLLTIEVSMHCSLDSKFDLLSDKLPHRLVEADLQPSDWLNDMICQSDAGHLQFDDYKHCVKSLQILRPYLRCSLVDSSKGVNVLLYGPPGTGKTQLAKLLAKDMGCELFEVTTEDEDGEAISGRKRLKALSATNSFFAKRQALILFDEIEDAFANQEQEDMPIFSTSRRDKIGRQKGWMNRLLESNNLPTLWIGNSLHGMDAAFIRRFDVVIEMPVPPKEQRERIVQKACEGLLDDVSIKRIAGSEILAPAVVTRSSRVVKSIATELPADQVMDSVELLINQTLQAQRHPKISRTNVNALPEIYDPSFVNTDINLLEVAQQLSECKTARMCLYGPPGTGKTAYGRWLADYLQVPLHVKRASDLMSMWVGETEKLIAKAFEQAQEEGALLLIDEVDSFLQSRQGAQRSWEVTQVNEMLTQMESFNGLFIASTNLMDGLDQAALRRFDLKLKFDYLKAPQAFQLMERHCAQLGLPEMKSSDRQALMDLKHLTPGDFATVIRQSRLRPMTDVAQLVGSLAQECALKSGAKNRPMGFVC